MKGTTENTARKKFGNLLKGFVCLCFVLTLFSIEVWGSANGKKEDVVHFVPDGRDYTNVTLLPCSTVYQPFTQWANKMTLIYKSLSPKNFSLLTIRMTLLSDSATRQTAGTALAADNLTNATEKTEGTGFLIISTAKAVLRIFPPYSGITLFIIHAVFCLVIAISFTVIVLLCAKKRRDRIIFDLSYSDKMTGLWNASRLQEDGSKIIAENIDCKYAMVAMDISHFYVINESYGRNVGDDVILFLASLLKSRKKQGAVAARVKADHFLILSPYTTASDLNHEIIEFSKSISSFCKDGIGVKLTGNFGVYCIENPDIPMTAAIDNAEMARQVSKHGTKRIVFFDESLEKRLREEKELEDTMTQALNDGEFKVYYQPKYDIATETVIGAEALIRWENKEKGIIVPSRFIPLFERNGFITEIDFFVLNEVCKLIKSWINKGITPLPISVNQSKLHLEDPWYVSNLGEIMRKYNIPERIIELELTESAFADEELVEDFSKKVHKMGFLLSIDDFGSGYSSLQMLNMVPLDILKIDQHFLSKTDTSERSKILLKKIVELAQELDMDVICEGVETQQQAQFLLESGCRYAQGFLYSRPMTQLAFIEYIEKSLF